MSLEIITTKSFEREAKRLARRYPSFPDDLESFKESLKASPLQGVELFPHVRKIRMSIKSKGRGKSGSARVITANALVAEHEGTIFLLLIYDKGESSAVDKNVLKSIVKNLDLPL